MNLQDTFELLLSRRPGHYPLEPELELVSLQAWMLWPQDPDRVRFLKLAAAARVISGSLAGAESEAAGFRQLPDRLPAYLFQTEEFASALLSPEYMETLTNYDIQIDSATEVTRIAEFFVRSLASGVSPSLNKAYFFISDNAWEGTSDEPDRETADEGNDVFTTRSPASLKKDWAGFGAASSFLYAAELQDQEAFWINPMECGSMSKAAEYLSEPGRIRRFLGQARSVQDMMARCLPQETIGRFPTFPDWVEAVSIQVQPFSDFEMSILGRYQAKLVR